MSITHLASRRSRTRLHGARRALPIRLAAFLGLLAAGGCGAGHYGFARTYKPLATERPHFEQAEQPTYQDVVRDPNRFAKREIGWFGVVNELKTLPDGQTRLLLALRTHQARHLCAEESRSSCRVTVSESGPGVFTVDLPLKGDELAGKERVWLGSLLKIYGSPTGEYGEESGPVIAATYYRHWPRGYYVTTAARASMRR